MTNPRPIIVFDSGIGGFSVYRPLKKLLTNESVIYLSDPAGFPYGEKSEAWLSDRFKYLSKKFQDLNPKLLVLACNSATTNIIHEVRASMQCPVIGIEPVIKPLAVFSRSLALMTASSASSFTTKNLLKKYGEHVEIFTPHGLASAIEFNDIEQMKINIHEITELVHKKNIQAVGLSCTHYPLILNELQKAMPDVEFIDPTPGVIREIVRVLESISI